MDKIEKKKAMLDSKDKEEEEDEVDEDGKSNTASATTLHSIYLAQTQATRNCFPIGREKMQEQDAPNKKY